MSLIAKLVISMVIAAAAATLTTVFQQGEVTGLVLFAIICAATVITTLLVSLPPLSAAAIAPQSHGRKSAHAAASGDGPREHGEVKWFNSSKGFGFITKDDGEEIFVHFRSIRGEGRRGLRDGQRVSFVVAQSDKGPQAEDVEGL